MEITTEFDLPLGYEDQRGEVHNHVVMRRVKVSDLFKVNSDPAIKRLARDGIKMNIGGIERGKDGKPRLVSGEVNPVAAQAVEANVHEMYTILFSQVVLSLGSIEKPTRNIFMGMYPVDLEFLVARYEELNKLPEMESKSDSQETSASPLEH